MEKEKWSKEIDLRRIELLKQGYSYRETAIILSTEFNQYFTKHMVEYRSRKTNTTPSQLMNNLSIESKEESEKLFPDEAYEVNRDLTFIPEKLEILKSIWNKYNDGKKKKILSLSDIHAPFANFKAIETAIKDNRDADLVVLNGDVYDGHALSDYEKLNDFNIEIELKQVFMLLDVLTKLFKEVVWVGGNHDFTRFLRYVSRKFGSGMKKYVVKRLNPIEYISEKYNNVVVVPHNWVEIGKCVFIHPNGYSSALMSTSINQTEYLLANKHFLPYGDFQALVQGHTHDLGEFYLNGIKIIEQGCLCNLMDYRFDNPSSRSWTTGYAVVYLDEAGNVDFNKTRNIII